ncbi:MAG TPA: hypothetical protein VGH27_29845 [Streptosporangiaceae bacterium]
MLNHPAAGFAARGAHDDDQRVPRVAAGPDQPGRRPFQEDTVSAYRDAAVALDARMTRTGLV